MASTLVRCTSCNGRKKIIGLGMIEKNCPNCKGIGWNEKNEPVSIIEFDTKKIKDVVTNPKNTITPIIKKKMGRPKKNKQIEMVVA